MNLIDITVTSNVQEFSSLRRFPADITIGQLKGKLELLTGVAVNDMQLELRTQDNKPIQQLLDDTARLGSVAQENMIVHVFGTNRSNDAASHAEDNSVPKFELSDEVYNQRTESVRAWKKQQGLGKYNVAAQKELQQKEQQIIEESARSAQNIALGQRCEVRLPQCAPRRGTVRFVGTTAFKSGHWVGVQYDEPIGKNNGSVEGKRYFECPANYGAFVRPNDVIVGDFPEEAIDNLDEI